MVIFPELFQSYLDPEPISIMAHKRIWKNSKGLKPGRWEYQSISFPEAVDDVIDSEAYIANIYWDTQLEEWMPDYGRDFIDYEESTSFTKSIKKRNKDFICYCFNFLKQHEW